MDKVFIKNYITFKIEVDRLKNESIKAILTKKSPTLYYKKILELHEDMYKSRKWNNILLKNEFKKKIDEIKKLLNESEEMDKEGEISILEAEENV